MKKTTIYLTIAIYLMTSLSAFAAPVFTESDIKVVQEEENNLISQSISISGTTVPELANTILTIGIVDSELDSTDASNYSALRQLVASSDGSFETIIPFQSGGSYKVRIGTVNSEEAFEETLVTASADTINTFIAGVKGDYDESELNSALLTNGEEIGFDLTIYKRLSEEKQEEICSALLDADSDATIEDLKSLFASECSVVAVSKQTDSAIVLDAAQYYKSLYGFADDDDEYVLFTDGGNSLRAYAAQMAGEGEYDTPAEFKAAIYGYSVLYDIYDVEITSQMINKLNTYSSYITNANNEELSSMTTSEKTNVVSYLAKNKAKSIDDLNSKLSYVIANYSTLYPSSTNKGGSSSGSSSSGGSSSVSTVTLPVVEQTVLPGEGATTVTTSFDDLGDAEWAREAITQLLSRGVVNGKSVGKYCPNDSVTRAEFVKLLTLGFELSANNAQSSFADVTANHWAYNYVSTASSLGLVKGLSADEFGAERSISREDMATLGYRVLQYFGEFVGKQEIANTFADFNSFSDYSKNAILMLSEHNMLSGYPDGTFKPKGEVTRAEAAQFIYNLIKGR